MELVIKAAAVSLAAAVMALTLKKHSPETALLLSVAASVLVASAAANAASEIKDFTAEIDGLSSLSPAVTAPMFKTVGIAIVVRLSSDVCRDAGQAALASAVELTGCAAAMYIALPLMRSVLRLIGELL